MSENKLKERLSRLHDLLEDTESIDSETRKLVMDLDEEINRLLDPDTDSGEFETVIDHAKAVETRFAVDHPVAERFLREIIDALAKVGI